MTNLLKDWDRLDGFDLRTDCPEDAEKALLEFARALKNWEQGDRESMVYFELFGSHEFTEQQEWVSGYQEWALKLVSDGKLLEAEEPDLEKEYSEEEGLAVIARLTELIARLETDGRARLMVESWRDWIRGGLEQSEVPNWAEKAGKK